MQYLNKTGLAYFWSKIKNIIGTKQDTLVSGTNIKTINNESLLGSGNISISGGGGSSTDVQVNGTSIVSNGVANLRVDVDRQGEPYSSNNPLMTYQGTLGSFVPQTFDSESDDSGIIYTGHINNDDTNISIIRGEQGASYQTLSSVVVNGSDVIITAYYDVYDEQEENTIEITPTSTTIHNIVEPRSRGDAVNLGYVDTQLGSKVDITKTAGIYTGVVRNNGSSIFMSTTNNNTNDIMTIGVLPTGIGFSLNGTDVIIVNSSGDTAIHNLVTPTNSTDAVNKQYVDDLVGDIETLLGGI